ncbi:MAG TPA: hypothetical protein VJ836_03760 [Candidatus Saccharimonadales bacterium]|nr:hypothetical protein [Candidatus Saccharimonadales bacterium]
MWRNRFIFLAYLVVISATTVLLGFVPDIGPSLALSFLVVSLELCAALLALSGLKHFQTGFKRVYYLISAGICLVALNSLLSSAFSLTHLVDEGGAWNLINNLLFTSGIALMCWGLVRLNHLIGAAPASRKLLYSLSLAVVGGLLLTMLPRLSGPLPEMMFDLQNFLNVLIIPLGLVGGYLALSIKQQINKRYASIIASLCWALVAVTAGIISATRKSTIYDAAPRKDVVNIIDVNVYLSSLASAPSRIDPPS